MKCMSLSVNMRGTCPCNASAPEFRLTFPSKTAKDKVHPTKQSHWKTNDNPFVANKLNKAKAETRHRGGQNVSLALLTWQ